MMENLRIKRIDEKTEILGYIKELLAMGYSAMRTHTDEDELKFSKCVEMVDWEIDFARIAKIDCSDENEYPTEKMRSETDEALKEFKEYYGLPNDSLLKR